MEIFSVKFSLDDEYVLCGLGDGRIQVFQTRTGELIQTLHDATLSKTPCTNIAFRPNDAAHNRTKNVICASYADGKIRHWHVTSGKKLSEFDERRFMPGTCTPAPSHYDGEDNQSLAVDFFRDGTKFATAGSDCTVRLYDEQTQQSIMTMYSGSSVAGTAGHSNRIFCAKFHPTDSNMIVTSGWDNTVQIWDARAKVSIRSIYGPHICGESVDIDDTGERILTGAYDKKNALQVWSFSNAALIETIPWTMMEEKKPCLLYSASFAHSHPEQQYSANQPAVAPRHLVAGGDIANEAKLFRTDSRKCIGIVTGMQNAVYSVALSHDEQHMAVGGGSKLLLVMDVDHDNTADLIY